jgi:GNAT superfamily N-acetyltransferase
VSARAAAVAWRHGRHAVVCDRVERWAHGTVVSASDLPGFYDYNLLRVEGPDPGVSAAELAATADGLQGAFGHRRIEVEHEGAGLRLRPGFEALGWHSERLAWLYRTGPAPDRAAPPGAQLRAAGFEATRPLRHHWQGETPWEESEAFAFLEEKAAARRGARAVIAAVGDEPAGFAAYSAEAGTVEIELVFCLPERRGAGLGAALVARALGDADMPEQFIEADDAGDSKRLYERLGFTTVWRRHVFTRVLAPPS